MIAVIVFLGVEGVLIYCLVKYRAKRGRVAAQIHGNTRLEIGWTVGAAVILVFLTVATFVMLPGIKNPAESSIDANGNPVASNAAFASTDQEAPPEGVAMNIKVDGMQYVWQYTYPSIDGKKVFSYTDMHVPVGMTVTLDIGSNDVQHSWWIPKLGGKMDALPGYTNKTLVQGHRAGRLRRPVRRALRAQPRQHVRARDRAAVRRVEGLVRPAGRRHQGGRAGRRAGPQGARAGARAAPSGPRAAAGGSSTSDGSRVEET